MPSSNEDRPKRYPMRRPAHSGDGGELGHPMAPNDVFVGIKHAFRLDDEEVREAMLSGAADVLESLRGTLDADPPPLGEIPEIEREKAAQEALDVTPSRLRAWRTRNRTMTWRELRVLLRGLRNTQ